MKPPRNRPRRIFLPDYKPTGVCGMQKHKGWRRIPLGVVALALSITLPHFAIIGSAVAAQITIDSSGDADVITIMGTLDAPDGQKFADAVASIRKAVVLFASNGGSVVAGLRIGKIIRLRNFVTAVPDGVRCASACALAWLGGTTRFMGTDAQIGFHAAYTVQNGAPQESGVANALVGSYLSGIGLPDEAVIYVTAPHPDEIQWLTLSDARRIGIDVALLPPMVQQPSQLPTAPSLLQPPAQPPAPTTSLTLEQAARHFVDLYFGRWSENNATAMAYVDGLYADQVDFYGSVTPRQTIVDLKRKFVERWPDRLYTVRPSSIKIDCDHRNATCLIAGLVDWDCRSVGRNVRSAGLADFTVRVAFSASGAARVVSEAGSVVSRSVTH